MDIPLGASAGFNFCPRKYLEVQYVAGYVFCEKDAKTIRPLPAMLEALFVHDLSTVGFENDAAGLSAFSDVGWTFDKIIGVLRRFVISKYKRC